MLLETVYRGILGCSSCFLYILVSALQVLSFTGIIHILLVSRGLSSLLGSIMESTKTMVIFSFIVMATLWISMADVYDVGDSDGWSLKVDYKEWSSHKKFALGDILGM